jgi:hypothetical protein
MSNYNIQWYNPNAGVSYISIASYGVTFNKVASDEMGNPKRVQIGLDAKKRVLFVKPLNEFDTELEKLSFPYAEREQKNGQTRVSSKELMNYLEMKCPELDLEHTTRFAAEWDETQGLLVMDLKKPILRQTSDDDNSDEVEVEAAVGNVG